MTKQTMTKQPIWKVRIQAQINGRSQGHIALSFRNKPTSNEIYRALGGPRSLQTSRVPRDA